MNKEELIERIKKMRKTLNNEMLDYLPYDIAEEIQDLFEEMLESEEK